VGHNVQSKAGETLTDVYDVRGGQAPIERIITADVQATHDMASTIFSERFSMFTRRSAVEVVQASDNINITITGLPSGNMRLLAIWVLTDDPSRLSHISVSAGNANRGSPIWAWDGTNSKTVRFTGPVTDGAVANVILLQPDPAWTQLPFIMAGEAQPQSVENLFLGGESNAFGAGDVDITFGAMLAFSDISGISSRGLPIPSW